MIFSGHVCIAYAPKTPAWVSWRIRAYAIRPYMGCFCHGGFAIRRKQPLADL